MGSLSKDLYNVLKHIPSIVFKAWKSTKFCYMAFLEYPCSDMSKCQKGLISFCLITKRQKWQENNEEKSVNCNTRIKNDSMTEMRKPWRDSEGAVDISSKLKRKTERKRSHECSLLFLLLLILILSSWAERRRWGEEGWSIMNCELPLGGAVWLLAVDKAELWQPYSAPSSIINHREGEHFRT